MRAVGILEGRYSIILRFHEPVVLQDVAPKALHTCGILPIDRLALQI